MKRAMLLFTSMGLWAGTTVQADDGRLPGTMNFQNVTASRVDPSTSEQSSNEKHVDIGDFDEDGDLDAVVAVAFSDFGARRNKLYENVNGSMIEITTDGAIPGFGATKVSRNAFFRDYDMDGHLDIWIINDQNSNNDQLFRAVWSGGTFDQFVEENNRIPNGGNTGAACSGWSADFDQDGFQDVYCGNYPNSSQDKLLNNQGNGFFTDITNTHVVASNDYVVDVNGADLNGDGKLDLLVSEHGGSQNRIYYNDLNGAGSEVGDFRYSGSQQNLGSQAPNENSMDAADFDNDGDMDIYWSNQQGSASDRILVNTGNDGNNKATFSILNILPPSTTIKVLRKVDIADFNNDGRMDAYVAKEFGAGRPTILRNVSVNGTIQFVDWTPANAFPTGNTHTGWQAALFDSNNDGDTDIFIGGWSGEHLFENVLSNELFEADLVGGVLPAFHNVDPIALVGLAGAGDSDEFIAEGIGSSSFISVVINGPDDYVLQVLTNDDNILMTSNRSGVGTEEAMQVALPSAGTYKIVVENLECGNPADIDGDCGVSTVDLLVLLSNWGGKGPGDYDGGGVSTSDLLFLLSNWGSADYILEVLSRTGP